GSGQNYINTVFDDQAAISITAGAPPFTGSFKPEGSLSTFNGINANGTWTLQIIDAFPPADNGTLTAWSVSITTGEPAVHSGADGYYELAGLTAGQHNSRRVLQPGFAATAPASGVYSYTHVSGATDFSRDFGQKSTPPAKVASVVVNDGTSQRSIV